MPLGTPINPKPEAARESQRAVTPAVDYELTEPKYSLKDIIVSHSTIQEIKSVIAMKREFEYVYSTLGFSETHSHSKKFFINFYGDPGTGKTITAHALAREFNKKILLIDYSQIESKYVGDTPKNLKKVFDFASKNDCLIFFDEADAILSRRVTDMSSATDTSVNQTRSVLLNILNDFEGDIIFTTNFISNYDPAFMRRIAKHVYFELPDQETRVLLFQKYIPSRLRDRIDLAQLAGNAAGLSAADIEKSTLMAAFGVAADGRRRYEQADVQAQIDLIKASKKANNDGPSVARSQWKIETNPIKDLK